MIMAILRFMMMIFGLGIYDKVPTWTNLAGSELRGQRRGPPPSPVQASAPVWPVNPIKLLQKNYTLTKFYLQICFYSTACHCDLSSTEHWGVQPKVVSKPRRLQRDFSCKSLIVEWKYGWSPKWSLLVLPEVLTGRWSGQPRAPLPCYKLLMLLFEFLTWQDLNLL